MGTDKHSIEPWGPDRGKAGRKGCCTINPRTTDEKQLPSRFGDHRLRKNDLLRLERPDGGGLGDPLERVAEKSLEDMRQGYVSIDRTTLDYDVVVELVDSAPALHLSATR